MANYPFRHRQDHQDIEYVNYFDHVLETGGDAEAAQAGLAKMSRDNARTPMQWDAGPYAGFSEAGSWMPVNPNHTWLNAASQVDSADSVFAHYRALIRLRHQLPILVDGDFTPLMADGPQLARTTRPSVGVVLVYAQIDAPRAGAGTRGSTSSTGDSYFLVLYRPNPDGLPAGVGQESPSLHQGTGFT